MIWLDYRTKYIFYGIFLQYYLCSVLQRNFKRYYSEILKLSFLPFVLFWKRKQHFFALFFKSSVVGNIFLSISFHAVILGTTWFSCQSFNLYNRHLRREIFAHICACPIAFEKKDAFFNLVVFRIWQNNNILTKVIMYSGTGTIMIVKLPEKIFLTLLMSAAI